MQNRKNASNRSDIAWKYGMEVDNNPRKIICSFCNKIISCGVYRFKQHLACTRKDVEACKSVPVEVKMEMAEVLTQLKKSSKRIMRNEEEEGMIESDPHKKGKMVKESISNKTIGNTLNSKKKLRDEACQQIVRFFRTSGIPFSCAKNPEFAKMFEFVGKCGSEFIPPSYHELENSSLEKEMKNTIDILEEYRYEWKKTGCSIICDEWTDMKGKFYCNFLVNNPAGTIFMKSIDTSGFSETTENIFEVLEEILEKVGEENVVQVMTNNTGNYKVAAKMLIEKRKKIVWSPCVIRLLDEILEDFEKNLSHHGITIAKGKKITTFIYSRIEIISTLRNFTKGKDFIGPTTTPSATAYLTLLYLFDIKDALITMCSMRMLKSEEVQQIVQDHGFWNDIVDCLNFALPIIEVILKIDSDEKPTMGFIYEETKCAKNRILSLNNTKGFETICKIIKERWNPLLHPLYSASYFLNPQLYRPDRTFENPNDHIDWLITMLTNDDSTKENQAKITSQLNYFQLGSGFLQSEAAMMVRHTKDPAKWWDSYGKHCPELQRMAIRLLNLTCSSCGSGQTWNAYEQVYLKKSSSLYQKKLNDLFLVIQNFKSKTQQARTKTFEGINPEVLSYEDEDEDEDEELITEKEVGEVSGAKKDMLVNVDVDEDVSEGVSFPGNYSGNEVDTCLSDPQSQGSASGVPLPGNHSGNEVDTCLSNPQSQGSPSGVPLPGNHSGNEVDTCLYKPQPQSATSAGSHLYSEDWILSIMNETSEMTATMRVPLPGNHGGNEDDTSWYIPQPKSVASAGSHLYLDPWYHDGSFCQSRCRCVFLLLHSTSFSFLWGKKIEKEKPLIGLASVC
ncbi:uncharacterized protein LOC122015007 isoform X2 [Zingiber officinale]|uniref:uncharacterized protein LOC122015007 isoform X2 n=1 Tax=Zingiber officinale TaxID=94328 RepID=UPI001C4CBFEB|nr:uncharacterized protein LOC122015007 isoform X2 [Zingiber officinale]